MGLNPPQEIVIFIKQRWRPSRVYQPPVPSHKVERSFHLPTLRPEPPELAFHLSKVIAPGLSEPNTSLSMTTELKSPVEFDLNAAFGEWRGHRAALHVFIVTAEGCDPFSPRSLADPLAETEGADTGGDAGDYVHIRIQQVSQIPMHELFACTSCPL